MSYSLPSFNIPSVTISIFSVSFSSVAILKIIVSSFMPIELTAEPFSVLINLFDDFLNTKSSPLKLNAKCVLSKLSGNEAVVFCSVDKGDFAF